MQALATEQQIEPFRKHVETAMRAYLSQSHDISDAYQRVLAEIEKPLLISVMKFTNNNQSRSADILGLSRGTLRKKLKSYQLL